MVLLKNCYLLSENSNEKIYIGNIYLFTYQSSLNISKTGNQNLLNIIKSDKETIGYFFVYDIKSIITIEKLKDNDSLCICFNDKKYKLIILDKRTYINNITCLLMRFEININF